MAKHTKIEWATHSWNPWIGCTKVSAGCDNCYMYRDQKRFGHNPSDVHRTAPKTFKSPNGWKEPARIFVCSWSDFFHPQVPPIVRNEAIDIMLRNHQHTYLLLTKRPENIVPMMPTRFFETNPNVWLGVTAENQEMHDKRVPILLDMPAAIKFVSAEPLLGTILVEKEIDWYIVGGESGPNFRPMKKHWALDIIVQCMHYEIPVFMKQMSGNTVKDRAVPDDLKIKEFPK